MGLEGGNHLKRVRLRNNESRNVETHNIRQVFLMTGADPSTRWVDGGVVCDANGFIKIRADLSQDELAAASGAASP